MSAVSTSTVWLHVTSGRGPAECCLAVAGLVPRLLEEAEEAGLSAVVLEAIPGPRPGTLSSALVSLEGEGREAFSSSWAGTICWNARSPFRPQHKRKNWFVAVSVLSQPSEGGGLDLRDVDVTAMRAGGPGGQHVNKTESAVRVVHRPTGLSVTAREERSQHRNRELALARLRALLDDERREEARGRERERWRQHDALERGRAARTYEGERFVLRR